MVMTRTRGYLSDPASVCSIRDRVFLALTAVVAAGATRILVLPLSVIDWDESVYLLVSRDVLMGNFRTREPSITSRSRSTTSLPLLSSSSVKESTQSGCSRRSRAPQQRSFSRYF